MSYSERHAHIRTCQADSSNGPTIVSEYGRADASNAILILNVIDRVPALASKRKVCPKSFTVSDREASGGLKLRGANIVDDRFRRECEQGLTESGSINRVHSTNLTVHAHGVRAFHLVNVNDPGEVKNPQVRRLSRPIRQFQHCGVRNFLDIGLS
jgi:hypothetical protein